MNDLNNPAVVPSGPGLDELDLQDLDDQIVSIRHTLLIGLESFGEVERMAWHFDLLKSAGAENSAALRPVHPTGTPDTVGVFAGALRLLETLKAERTNPSGVDAFELYATTKAIRRALHIGLHCFGEVERISDYCDSLRRFGEPCNEQLEPVHPTGASDTVGMFANALRLLDVFEPEGMAAQHT